MPRPAGCSRLGIKPQGENGPLFFFSGASVLQSVKNAHNEPQVPAEICSSKSIKHTTAPPLSRWAPGCRSPVSRGFSMDSTEAWRPRGCGRPAQVSAPGAPARQVGAPLARGQAKGTTVPEPLRLLRAECDPSPFSRQRSHVLGVGGNPPLPALRGYSCMNLSLAVCRLTQVTSFPMQVAVNGAQFLMQRAFLEHCLSHIRAWMSPRDDENTHPLPWPAPRRPADCVRPQTSRRGRGAGGEVGRELEKPGAPDAKSSHQS